MSVTEHSSLLALASHAAGDFPLQTDQMAAAKFDDRTVRAEHVSTYVASFFPFTLAMQWDNRQRATFLTLLWGSHFLIDSRRWNDAVPIWMDQALHVIALALSLVATEVLER